MKINTHLTLLLLASAAVFPTENQADSALTTPLWQDIASKNTSSVATKTFTQRHLKLDEAALETLISDSFSAKRHVLPINIPLPDGRNIAVQLHPEQTLSPELQQQFPNIHTWKITSDSTEISSGRAELTELGFYAMLRMNNGERLLIEPEQPTTLIAERSYRSFNKHESIAGKSRKFSCGASDERAAMKWQRQARTAANEPMTLAERPGKTLLTYDLAVAATGEYTQQFGSSASSAYSAIITTVNRLNEIFEPELGLKFRLVSGTETVFTDPNTDPFDNGSSLLASYQNQEVLDTYIGSNRYDIGHVLGFSQGGDGIALVSSICEAGSKAQGYTASNDLLSDGFIVDFIAHELGHQLGATHTFNGTRSTCGGGGRIAETAYEPGSGSTIMSYAGLCGSDDMQANTDPQFHSDSIGQIREITHDGFAASCATTTALSNNLPQVNAGIDRTIPARTPFILNGTASDNDGDSLLYGWDQVDLGSTSTLGTDTGNNPLIKSSELSVSGLRTVPDIQRLLTTSQTSSMGESLPRSTRHLDFRLTVRDGKGSTESDDIRLNVHDTGERFSVTSPTNTLNSGNHTITWNVADTNLAPISCNAVDIAYTNNQGATFTNLLLNTPNDGSENIQLGSRAENIRVKCNNNVFFALSATSPHIATYNGDSGQSSGNGTNTTDNSDGGGGTAPLPLLLMGGLFATLLTRSRLKKLG